MAQRLGWFDEWFRGAWAERDAINQHADEITDVQLAVTGLHTIVRRQAEEIVRLRATIMGVVEVLHAKTPFDDAELDQAVRAALQRLTAPPAAAATDPYRNVPVEPAAAPERQVQCTRCGRWVPASRTNITATGEVCDACC